MKTAPDAFAERRAALAADIALQRGELARAYQNLEKPIRYTEYGMRGFGFIRANPWIFVAVPAVMNIVSMVFGLGKSRTPKASPVQQQQVRGSKLQRVQQGASKMIRFGVELFKLYRRIRSYIP